MAAMNIKLQSLGGKISSLKDKIVHDFKIPFLGKYKSQSTCP